MGEVEAAFKFRSDKLFFYSPYNFLREVKPDLQLQYFVKDKLNKFSEESDRNMIFTTKVGSSAYHFFYSYLPWDTDFFKVKTYKLFTILYSNPDPENLIKAIQAFKAFLFAPEKAYCFIEIPAEDILLMQCLGNAGFRTVETRLTYYRDNLVEFDQERYPVRKATAEDAGTIGKVSAEMRNEYDRFHADTAFTLEQGDAFLQTYAEAAVNGYCDTVLVPDDKNTPTEAFLAISHIQADSDKLNCQLARVVLTAVGPGCKGWHLKLVSETTHYAKSIGAKYVLMTTQATNRAVFRTSEKLGFKLGGTLHILAFNN